MVRRSSSYFYIWYLLRVVNKMKITDSQIKKAIAAFQDTYSIFCFDDEKHLDNLIAAAQELMEIRKA